MKFIAMINVLYIVFALLAKVTLGQVNTVLQTILLILSITAVLLHMIKKKEYKTLAIVEDPGRALKELKESLEEVKKMSKFKIFKVLFNYLNPKLNKNSQLSVLATLVLALILGHLLGVYNIPWLEMLSTEVICIIAGVCLLLGAKVTIFAFETAEQATNRIIEQANKIYDKTVTEEE